MSDGTNISYFNENLETFLYCDASPFGVSSILLQRTPKSNNLKVISYSSRALTEVEQRYSQIERECLSIVHACERNRLYLLGSKFQIYNDHKALINLLNNPNATIHLRIERMSLRLQGYNFQMKHVKGEENISDYSSRHPVSSSQMI